MDLPTLLICTALTCSLMIMSTGAMYKVNTSESYLRDWIFVGVFFLFSNLLAIAANWLQLSSPIFPALGNAFYMAGHAALLSGVSVLVNKQSMWRVVLVVAVLTVLAHAIPEVSKSVTTRILVFYPIIAALDGAALVLLLKRMRSEQSRGYWPLVMLLSFFVLQLVVRGGLLLSQNAELTLLGNQFTQTFGHLLVIGFIFLLTICFSIIVTWRKELMLRRASITDFLTGWYNREGLETIASRVFRRDLRGNTYCGFILLDIDHFKSINDHFGHAAGDTAIKAVTAQISDLLRIHDYGFRIGGEEFAVLVSNTNTEELSDIAERIRRAVETHKVSTPSGSIAFTVSAGVALRASTEENFQQTLNRADSALYKAKAGGRNRVSVATNAMFQNSTLKGGVTPDHCKA